MGGDLMGIITTMRLRMLRAYYTLRARLALGRLRPVQDHTAQINAGDILLVACFRNESPRLAFFLDYYRRLRVQHFLFIDNDSDDGGIDHLLDQPDVSVWHSRHSYRKARFGMDWVNGLLARYGQGHWCLAVDVDEFLIYPHHDMRPLGALCDWLDHAGLRSFGAMLLDLYPEGPLDQAHLASGQNPMTLCRGFDLGNLRATRDPFFHDLWIQGGVRERAFFTQNPGAAPALNKVPLVRWARGYAYVSSTHRMLPRGRNKTYGSGPREMTTGLLLHPKFVASFDDKASEELARRQHYAQSAEYRAYASNTGRQILWHDETHCLQDWQQLERLGLMSRGPWV